MNIWMVIRVHRKHRAIQIKLYCVWAHHHRIRPMRNSRLPLKQNPFHEQFIFQINKQNMFCYYMRSNDQIRSQFCTCHDSSAVMACKQICNLIRYLESKVEHDKFLQDLRGHNAFVKWVSGVQGYEKERRLSLTVNKAVNMNAGLLSKKSLTNDRLTSFSVCCHNLKMQCDYLLFQFSHDIIVMSQNSQFLFIKTTTSMVYLKSQFQHCQHYLDESLVLTWVAMNIGMNKINI